MFCPALPSVFLDPKIDRMGLLFVSPFSFLHYFSVAKILKIENNENISKAKGHKMWSNRLEAVYDPMQ